MGDVDIIVREKLHGDTLKSIRKLSSDLEELSAFVKKVTNPEAPLRGTAVLVIPQRTSYVRVHAYNDDLRS